MFKINQSIPAATRYDMHRFMPFSDMFDVLDSSFISRLKSLRKHGIYPVTVEDKNPALISERIYGLYKTEYWWIIMMYNNLTDITQIKTGMILNYPFRDDLDALYFSLIPNETKVN